MTTQGMAHAADVYFSKMVTVYMRQAWLTNTNDSKNLYLT